MADKYITIQEAAEISGKSIQTIRRAIKAKKLDCKKKKTPQGFNYSISQESLTALYGVQFEEHTVNEPVKAEKPSVKADNQVMSIDRDDFKMFAQTMEKLITQHTDERQSFLRLVNTLQEKIFVLENQINLLKAPERKWYQVWK